MLFGIGFPRTGTNSLTHGLKKHLGFNVVQELGKLRAQTFYGNWRFPEEIDGVVGGIPFAYRLLDRKYPNSKFIYTVRDDESWLDSMRCLYAIKDVGASEAPVNVLLRVFGVGAFDEDYLMTVKRSHELGMDEYFCGRSDLLKFDVKDGWEPLCDFLGLFTPTIEFPHEAKSMNVR